MMLQYSAKLGRPNAHAPIVGPRRHHGSPLPFLEQLDHDQSALADRTADFAEGPKTWDQSGASRRRDPTADQDLAG
jgi:hypothetical protein